jgi:hypothetical protein
MTDINPAESWCIVETSWTKLINIGGRGRGIVTQPVLICEADSKKKRNINKPIIKRINDMRTISFSGS